MSPFRDSNNENTLRNTVLDQKLEVIMKEKCVLGEELD